MLISPTRNLLLVEPAEEALSLIARPETARPDDPDRGTIVAAGPEAPEWCAIGSQVIWYVSMGFGYQIDGKPYLLISPSDICLLVAEDLEDPWPAYPGGTPRGEAPPGSLIIQRDEMAERYGQKIVVPTTYRSRARKTTGTVLMVGKGVDRFEPGQRVLLGAGAGRAFFVGHARLYLVYPESVVATLQDEALEAEETRGQFKSFAPPAKDRLRIEDRAEPGYER